MGLKSIIKKFLPAYIIRTMRKPAKYGFFGDYKTWQEAVADSKGYDSPEIFEKLRISAQKIKDGEAAFERDTVAFKNPVTNEFLLSTISTATASRRSGLSILDFGGSFGNVYLQHKDFLDKIEGFKWIVVEQPHVAQFGRKEFGSNNLIFYPDNELDTALENEKSDIVFFGSSLQYAEKPFEVLGRVLESASTTMIALDRTPFFEKTDTHERIVIQKVRPEIYDASYPAHIFGLDDMKKFMTEHSFHAIKEVDQGAMSLDGYGRAVLKGLVFKSDRY